MIVTLITGTSSGIGLSTALHLARKGQRVYASMRDLHRGDALRVAAAADKLHIELVELNVHDESSVHRAVAHVLKKEGHIDVLVNNAGIAPFGAIELTSDATAKTVFETNFFGALRTIRAVLPSMRARGSGRIINISSVAGRLGSACMGIYAASKFALEAASEALAQEVFPLNIRVVLIEPGIVVTPILGKALETLSPQENSPYKDQERRLRTVFELAQETGGDPRQVAEVIELAINAKDPKLRYTAGADAAQFVNGRSHMTDEAWVRMHRHKGDHEYFQEFSAAFYGS